MVFLINTLVVSTHRFKPTAFPLRQDMVYSPDQWLSSLSGSLLINEDVQEIALSTGFYFHSHLREEKKGRLSIMELINSCKGNRAEINMMMYETTFVITIDEIVDGVVEDSWCRGGLLFLYPGNTRLKQIRDFIEGITKDISGFNEHEPEDVGVIDLTDKGKEYYSYANNKGGRLNDGSGTKT